MAPRVVSLIPSGTEIVAALGMLDTLVGRSHCCDHPPTVRALPVLSRPKVDPGAPGDEIDRVVRALMADGESVYDILMEPLLAARPDVVITQDHCDACAVSLRDVEAAVSCAELAGARVCALHPHDLAAVRGDFARVAAALEVPRRGEVLVERFDRRLEEVRRRTANVERRPRVVLVEWLEPPMVAGGWIPELARIAGLEPAIVTDARQFAQVEWRDIDAAEPDAIVVLPCGYSVDRTLDELRGTAPGARLEALGRTLPLGCWVVDGDALFNRPGPRLADSAELLAAIFHPDATAQDAPHGLRHARRRIGGTDQRVISVPSSMP